jgi:S-DNA-T family DNA segregation ATPase FtsK/SpoIIIE
LLFNDSGRRVGALNALFAAIFNMSRRNNRRKKEEKSFFEDFRLEPDTKKSVWAVVFFCVSVLLTLAAFGSAGPLGGFFYGFLEKMFGWGYWLFPLIFLALAGVFISSEKQKIYKITFFGAALFAVAGLGLIDVIFPEEGGVVGNMAGAVERLFGYAASIIILVAVLAISAIITLNLPIKIKRAIKELGDDDLLTEEESRRLEEKIAPKEKENKSKKEKEPEEDSEEDSGEEIEEKSFSFFGAPKKQALKQILFKDYVAPPLSLLKSSVEKPTSGDLRANANIIKRTLESFGISVEMGEINIGPKVTRYTLKPAEGVKLSRLTALNQDLALALASHPIRIEAPIPGKSLVGIEVPNKASALVRLGSLMAYPEFSAAGNLGFVLGRDVTGDPLFANLEKMPHILIAGSTGSGKSIMIHSLLISLLYKNSPGMMRLILIDPKRVELSLYANLPHLIAPVITESKKALGVFRWAVEEMDRRYEILLSAASRDIQSYNKKFPDEPLPYIVIVIDELADLMTTYGREVEGTIVRLAQMARATGIHLVLSTQRPSVEVVTGLIKANITGRIALQLPSQIDSRTVLDTSGAEKLLGGGDMLFISSDFSKPRRIQGAFLSEEEVSKVTGFIKENNKSFSENGEEIDLSNGENLPMFAESENGDDDELLDDAIKTVAEAKKASASLLQRRLKVGYARAARLLDIMESRGIIGPGEGAKPREVYIDSIQNNNNE